MSTHPYGTTPDAGGGNQPSYGSPDRDPYDKQPPGGGGGYTPGGHDDGHNHDHGAQIGCAPIPEFKRLNYFYGQMLGANDFKVEQDYFREKMKLHNRCLHGYGVVCGLRVVPLPIDEDCAPEADARVRQLREEWNKLKDKQGVQQAGDQEAARAAAGRIEQIERELEKIRTEECDDEPATMVVVECGLALDCDGNELVVRRPITIDLWRELSRADRDRVRDDAKGTGGADADAAYSAASKSGANAIPGKVTDRDKYTGESEASPYEADAKNDYAYDDTRDKDDKDDAVRKPYEEAPYGARGEVVKVKERPYDGGGGGSTLYVSICFCEQPTDPVRPVMPEACGQPAASTYGKMRDSVKVRVTTTPPDADKRCAACCEACEDNCLLLARIDNFRRGRALSASDIFNEVRRPVSLYQMTTITGISWTDGAEYTEDEAEALLGVSTEGEDNPPNGYMLVRFSCPVHVSTIRRGVIDVWVTEGGSTQHAGIYNHDVEFVDLPASGMTDRIRFRIVSDESPNPGDRVMIFVRGSRLLDKCCRPIDAANTGGRTPFVPDEEFKDYWRESPFPECQYPPPFGYGPWTSGTNAAGSDFVSWFYIKANPRAPSKKAS